MEVVKLARGKLDWSRPPVLLLGHLNLIRPLGLAGIPIILVTTSEDDPALHSRYVGGRCVIPGLTAEQQQATLERLLKAGRELAQAFNSRIPILYGSDEALGFLHRFQRELALDYLLLLNDDELAGDLADKERFYRRCCAAGVLVPRTRLLAHCDPAELADLRFPVILKPRQKVHWQEMKRELFDDRGKARIIERPEDLRWSHPGAAGGREDPQVAGDALIARYRDQLVVTEYIPGDDDRICSFHGYADEQHRLLASFVGRKLRTYPALTGESSFIELYKDPALVEVGRRIVARLGLRGAFKIDLKKSTADGLYYALEINARFNLWHYIGAVNGINLPAIAYRHLLARRDGLQPASEGVAREYATSTRWLNFYLDYHTAKEMRARGELSLAGWLLSLVGRNVYSAFAWEDPVPFVRWMSDFLRRS